MLLIALAAGHADHPYDIGAQGAALEQELEQMVAQRVVLDLGQHIGRQQHPVKAFSRRLPHTIAVQFPEFMW